MDADASRAALQHVERIRKDKFGIGNDGLASNPLAGDMHQAVALLAQGLYQKETHFILELIQNAEDNSYPEGQEPQLLFSLAAGDPTAGSDTGSQGTQMTLGLFNNEVGFKEENVDALCSVGMSTKKDKSFGYIGEKGIGFKSVFVVSKTPCVISNGYRFRFDEDVDPSARLGYIVPSWLPSDRPSAEQLQQMGAPPGTRTAILLPLKDQKSADVQRQLAELAPETILFLRKLRSLVILDKVQNRTIGVAKHRTPYPSLPVFELQTPHSPPATFVLREGAWRVPADVKEEKRVGVDVWRVTVAFPLDNTPSQSRADVYAFLPTEVQSGWPFLINADFLLTVSRESIAFGTPWNQGLLGCARAAFVEGYLEIQNVSTPLPMFGGGSAAPYEVLRFIPTHTNTSKLEPLRHQMIAELSTKKVVPLAPVCTGGPLNAFSEPPRARIIQAAFLSLLETSVRQGAALPRAVHPSTPANERLGLVHPDAAARFRPQLSAIGVKEATAAEYTAIFADPSWMSSLGDELYVELLLLFMGSFSPTDLVPLAKADALRYVDPATGAVQHARSTLQKPIYLPPKATQDAWLLQQVTRLQPLAPVRLLAPSFFEALSACPRAVEVIEWLRRILQVKDLSVSSYAEQVLQVAKPLRDAGPLLAVTDFFLAAHTNHAGQELGNISLAELPLVAEDGSVLVRWAAPGADKGVAAVGSKTLLMPRDVSDWPALLDGDKGWAERVVKLHPAYLGTDQEQRPHRLAFLRGQMQAVDLAHIQPPNGMGLACLDKAKATRRGVPVATARGLIKWLAALVPQPGAKEARDSSWARGRDMKPSVFAMQCKEAPWMPTSLGGRKPAETFMRSDAVVRLLGDSLPFVVEGVATPGDIEALKWLGVRVEVTPEDVAAHIRTLARGPASAVELTGISKLYGYLAANSWTPPIRRGDEGGPLPVWLPAGVAGRAEAQWRAVEQCVWEGVDSLFAAQFACLSDVYRRPFQDFFEKMGVLPTPPVSCYMRAWLSACSGGASLGRERGVDGPVADLELAESVWTKLAADYRDVKLQEEWDEFKRSGLVPVTARTPADEEDETPAESGWQDGMPPTPKKPVKAAPKPDFVRLKPGVEAFIPDDLNLEKLFSEAHPGLPVAWQPGAVSGPALPSLFAIYHEMGAGFFTTASTLIVTPSGRTVPLPIPRSQAQTGMELIKPVVGRSLLLAVMGFLSSQAHGAGPEFQTSDVRQGCLLPLVEASEVAVEKLEVTYRLRNAAGDVVAQVEGSRRCHWAKEQKTLFRALEADDPLKGGKKAQRGSGELETAVDIVKAVARAVIDERLGNRAEVVARLEDFLLPFAMQGLYNKDYLTRELLLKKNVRINAVDEAWILSGAFTVEDFMSEDEDEPASGWGNKDEMNGQPGKAWEGDSAMSEGPLPEEGYAPSASGRTSGSRTCFRCGKEGHISRDCPLGGGRLCFKCGEEGHIARDCQNEVFGGSRSRMMRDRQNGPLRDDWAQQMGEDEFGPSDKYDREMMMIDARQFVQRQYGSLREYIAAQAGGGDQIALEICNQVGYSPMTVSKKPVELRKDAQAALNRLDSTPPERSARVNIPEEVIDRLRWWTMEHLPQVRTKLGFAASQEAGAASGQELGDGMLDRCLTLAFLHESYLGVRLPSYERLEFLGDAWLNAVISSRLFELHPKAHEGLLSEMRAALTRNQVNALYLRALLLDQHVILNEATPTVKDDYGMVRDDICSDVLEAIIGAVFYAFGPKGPFMVYKLINEKITPKLLGT